MNEDDIRRMAGQVYDALHATKATDAGQVVRFAVTACHLCGGVQLGRMAGERCARPECDGVIRAYMATFNRRDPISENGGGGG